MELASRGKADFETSHQASWKGAREPLDYSRLPLKFF